MKDTESKKSKPKSPYNFKRGDKISVILNGIKKEMIAVSKSDFRNSSENRYEPLLVGSNLFKFLEKNCTELFLKEMKYKNNSIRLVKIVRT